MKVLCLIIHGIGEQTPVFAEPLTGAIHRKLEKRVASAAANSEPWANGLSAAAMVEYRSLYWSNICEGAQGNLYRKIYPDLFGVSGSIKRLALLVSHFAPARHLSFSLLGDIFSYLGAHGQAIKQEVLKQVTAALQGWSSEEQVSLVIVAHSLGSVIIHDLLSRMLRYRFAGIQALAKSTSIITMGSPIALFSLVQDTAYPNEFRRWINFWHPRDPISFPLQGVHDFVEDVKLGKLSWNPGKLHSHYWHSARIADTVANEICEHHAERLGCAPLRSGLQAPPPEILQREHAPSERAGLSEYFYDFSDIHFPSLLRGARKIDFCNVYGGSWLERNAQYFAEALCREDADIRACFVDEHSESVRALAYQFRGKTPEQIRQRCRSAVELLRRSWETAKSRSQRPGRLRVYSARTIISHSFYRFDDVVFCVPRSIASNKLASTPIPAWQLRQARQGQPSDKLSYGSWLIRDFEELLKEPYDHLLLFDSKEDTCETTS